MNIRSGALTETEAGRDFHTELQSVKTDAAFYLLLNQVQNEIALEIEIVCLKPQRPNGSRIL